MTATPYLAGVAQSPIAMAELGATGVYQGDMAGGAGTYQALFFVAGETLACGSGQIKWDGAAEEPVAANVTQVNGVEITGAGIETTDEWRPA